MKAGILFFISLFCYIPFNLYAERSPIGTWTTIDDKTGEKRAVIRIEQAGKTLNGTIVRVYPQAGDTGICSKCPGKYKDKEIQGLQFLRELSDNGNGVWSGGTILDPKTGKIYRAKLTMEGNKLYVRGYIGISAIGRTQTWIR